MPRGKVAAPTRVPHLVTKGELAKRVGRTAAVITNITQGQLCHVVQHGRVDVTHPDLLAYAAKHWGVGLDELLADDEVEQRPRLVEAPNVADVQTEQIDQMRLSDIRERWGGLPNFKQWLDARHVLETIRAKELKNLEYEGKLIPRQLVQTHVIGVVDGTSRRLLQDGPKTIAQRVYALAQSGQPVEYAEKLVRDYLSSQLRPVRDKVVRILGDVEGDASGDE